MSRNHKLLSDWNGTMGGCERGVAVMPVPLDLESDERFCITDYMLKNFRRDSLVVYSSRQNDSSLCDDQFLLTKLVSVK
jgi:hypothetical protein